MNKLTTSFIRNRIEDHLDEFDLDVVCRKRKSGYALYWDDDQEPIAKLHPTGSEDQVDIFSWEDGRWRKVNEPEESLPLDEALEYITDDPDDLFFNGDNDDQEPARFESIPPDALRSLNGFYLMCSMIGGMVGGMFSGSAAGAAGGAFAGILCAGVPRLLRGRITHATFSMIAVGAPATIPAAAGGALGGSLHVALGSGIGWLLCSAVAGLLCSFLLLCSRILAWGIGLAAGVLLGMEMVEAFSPASDTARFALVSVVAAVSASVCFAVAKWNAGILELINDSKRSE